MKKILLSLLWLACAHSLFSQKPDSALLVQLNQEIDQAVVDKDTALLRKRYADDFVFSHGSGRVEGRSSWLGSVMRNNYPQRSHDSVTVELHPDIAIVKGKMTIRRVAKEKTDKYHLKYVRVYAKRGQWLLISHSTTWEMHEP